MPSSAHVRPKTRRVPGVGPDEAEEHPEEGRLAGAVGSEHAVHLPGGDLDA